MWAKATATRLNRITTDDICVQIVEVLEKDTINETICDATASGVKALISVASCSLLLEIVPRAFETRLINFVVDEHHCVQFPIKDAPEQIIFLDRTFRADVTQAITDIMAYNHVSDVIVIDDRRRGQTVAAKLVEKLSGRLISSTFVRINSTQLSLKDVATNLVKKMRTFGPATWKNHGLHVVSLVDQGLIDQLVDEMERTNLLRPHLKIFQVEDNFEAKKRSMKEAVKAKYWFELREAFLRREWSTNLIPILEDLMDKYVSEMETVHNDEAFIVAAVESTAKAFKETPLQVNHFRCDGALELAVDSARIQIGKKFAGNIFVSVSHSTLLLKS